MVLLENEEKIILHVRAEKDYRDFEDLTDLNQKTLEIESDPKVNFEIPKRLPSRIDPIIKKTKKWYNKEAKIPEDLEYYERYHPRSYSLLCFQKTIQSGFTVI